MTLNWSSFLQLSMCWNLQELQVVNIGIIHFKAKINPQVWVIRREHKPEQWSIWGNCPAPASREDVIHQIQGAGPGASKSTTEFALLFWETSRCLSSTAGLTLWSTCLSKWTAGLTGLHHHAQNCEAFQKTKIQHHLYSQSKIQSLKTIRV